MNAKNYIQVIVPLKLDWEPVYSVPEGLEVAEGDRVSVIFSGKEYISVVSKVGVTPSDGISEAHIQPVLDIVDYLPRITELEMRFWKMIASYYLCTLGEVYKSVYFQDQKPPRKWAPKDRSAIAAEPGLKQELETAFSGTLDAFSNGRTVLLHGAGQEARTKLYLKLAVNAIKNGKSVLYLVPGIAISSLLEERIKEIFQDASIYHSGQTAAKRRNIVLEARQGRPMLVLGTRSSLFIPFSNLGLIIVDEEQDVFYKQDSPAPRYHARECAIMLASVCGANVILGSSTPSLEALHNARTGLFSDISLSGEVECPHPVTIIDTSAERRKRGMVGEVSLKLLAEVKVVADSGGKILVVSWAEEPELQGVTYATPVAVKSIPTDGYDLIAVLQADTLIGRQDFRSDERALQLLRRLNATCPLVIQTKESSHPVFQALTKASDGLYDNMMAERQAFGYPPFTRMVKLELKDSDENRQKLRARFLGNRVKEVLRPFSDPLILGPEKGEIRIFFKRDKNLTAGKQALYKEVTSFEQQYSCHIIIDVDPV